MGTGLKRAMRPITHQLRLFSNRLLGIEPELEIDPAPFCGFQGMKFVAPRNVEDQPVAMRPVVKRCRSSGRETEAQVCSLERIF